MHGPNATLASPKEALIHSTAAARHQVISKLSSKKGLNKESHYGRVSSDVSIKKIDNSSCLSKKL